MVRSMDFTWALALVPFLSAGAGAYFGGYLKKKGENLAGWPAPCCFLARSGCLLDGAACV